MSMRDAINRMLEQNAQTQVRLETVANNASFGAYDEWVCITSTNPQQTTGAINLINNSNSTVMVVGNGVPFFVSGAQKYTVNTGAAVFVQRAPRKELLTDFGFAARDFASNGASFSDVYDDSFSVGFAAGNWAYLDENLVWQTSLIGTIPATGYPFGWAATNKDLSGRYYTIDYEIQSSAPAVNCYLNVYSPAPIGNVSGASISADLTVIQGTCAIGDVQAALLLGPSYGPTAYMQSTILSRPKWTLCIRPTAAGATTFGGSIKIIRRGF